MKFTAENAKPTEHEILLLFQCKPDPALFCDFQIAVYKALDYNKTHYTACAWFAGDYSMAVQIRTRHGADHCATYAEMVMARLPYDDQSVVNITSVN